MDQSSSEIMMTPTQTKEDGKEIEEVKREPCKNSYQVLFEGRAEVKAQGEFMDEINLCELLRDLYSKIYKLESQVLPLLPNKE